MHTEFCCGVGKERDHVGDPSVDGKMILKWVLKHWDGWERVNWINLTQDIYKQRAVVNAVMNLRVL